jgi:hypothetical protein
MEKVTTEKKFNIMFTFHIRDFPFPIPATANLEKKQMPRSTRLLFCIAWQRDMSAGLSQELKDLSRGCSGRKALISWISQRRLTVQGFMPSFVLESRDRQQRSTALSQAASEISRLLGKRLKSATHGDIGRQLGSFRKLFYCFARLLRFCN